MVSKLDVLLLKKISLHKKKYSLAMRLCGSSLHYISAYGSINSLKIAILREKSINSRILKELVRMHRRHLAIMPLMDDLKSYSSRQSVILDDEYRILKGISLLHISSRNLSVFVSKEKSVKFLKKSLDGLKRKLEEENSANDRFIGSINAHIEKLASKVPGFSEKQKEFSEARKLVSLLQSLYMRLIYEIDPKKAKIEAFEILQIINKLKKMELYGYMRSDFNVIRKKVIEIVRHPKENKLASVLAGAYIIAPGTFELTFAFLMAKYAGKYAKKQFSRKKFFRKASRR